MARLAALAIASALVVAGACGGRSARHPDPASLPPVASNDLRPVEAFASIGDRAERSRALFGEMSRVLFHPRCLNCHPSGDSPLQGDHGMTHDPPVARGPFNEGVPGLECSSCHQDKNLVHARVPGSSRWHLAPKTMAWVGRSQHEVCEQLKDPKRNGERNLQQLVDHSAHDDVVAWGWSPGWGRIPAPGTQAKFGALVAAWVESGAECPDDRGSAEGGTRLGDH